MQDNSVYLKRMKQYAPKDSLSVKAIQLSKESLGECILILNRPTATVHIDKDGKISIVYINGDLDEIYVNEGDYIVKNRFDQFNIYTEDDFNKYYKIENKI